jgi:alkanesulfonate monooxygenase SsuD/methylene tetrahydromethanopterin reductase-like flavin-dependent oxidoreductase (luciferase family)
MKSSLFYEHQIPRPWGEGAEQKLFNDALDQIELADGLGFDGIWVAEHHFLEEYSHCSAPAVFLAAVSQRTKRMRLGQGVSLAQPAYNNPVHVAERLATLDLLSNGRVEWGSGSSATLIEMHGFGVDPAQKSEMMREGFTQTANMLSMTPYPGFKGEYFSVPTRNVVPKPVQKPHPPMWMACSRRESILEAARNGMGALVFGFCQPEQAKQWVDDYYATIKSEECVPLGHTVNANFATLNGMMVHETPGEAERRGLDGFKFFGYGLSHYVVYGEHFPGVTNLWEAFQQVKEGMVDIPGSESIGTPDQVREHLLGFMRAGVDQMIFIQQAGMTQHEHICEALKLFASEIMPALKEGAEERERRKAEELAPYIEAALARRKPMPALAPEDVPGVASIGLELERQAGKDYDKERGTYADPTRGGAIPMAKRELFKTK